MQKIIFFLSFFLIVASCTKSMDPDPGVKPVVSLDSLVIEEGNDDHPVYISVKLDRVVPDTLVVIFQSIDETAEAGSDYKALNNYPLQFLPGDIQNNLKIEIFGDEMHEEDERFLIQVVSPVPENEEPATTSITLLNDDRDTSLVIPTTGYETPSNYENMDLIWSDEFDQGQDIEENWTFEYGGHGWGNNEWQYYKKENTSIRGGGYLVIEAKEENHSSWKYTSSRIITKDKFEFKYGRVDIRANLPYGQGIWPALWMLGHNISSVGWPACGEIDIMELVGHLPATTFGTAHWSNAGQKAQHGGNKKLNSGIFNDEFHVFSIIWDENQIEWLLDDVKFHSINITPAELSEFHQDYFFIFNVAVGGNWPGYPDKTTEFPQRMIVDYIRVFQ